MRTKTTLEYILIIKEMSYLQASKEIGVSPQQFTDWLKRRRPVPSKYHDMLKHICGFGTDYLFDQGSKLMECDQLNRLYVQQEYIKETIDLDQEENAIYKSKLMEVDKDIRIELLNLKLKSLAAMNHTNFEEVMKDLDSIMDQHLDQKGDGE